jgi:hypothetical protein
MAKYLVRVSLEYDTSVVVEANDVYEANELAREEVGNTFVVYNSDLKEYLDWQFITPFDPEEVV